MGTDEVRDAVLDSARAAFHARGYARTSMKTIAAAAGVAPEVLGKYYGSKDKLFAAALRLPFDPATAIPQLVAPGLEGMGERLTRVALETLGDPETRDDLVALARAGASTGKAVTGLRSYLEEGVVDKLAGIIGVPDARLRANLIVSYLLGIAINRYVVRLDPIASMSDDDVVRLVSPTIQDWLTPTKPLPGSVPDKNLDKKNDPRKNKKKGKASSPVDAFDSLRNFPS